MLFRIGLFLINVGFFCSRLAISMGMIFLFFDFVRSKNLLQVLKDYAKQKHFLLFESIFLIYLFSGIYSNDLSFFLSRLQLMLPLLVLPIAFSARQLPTKEIRRWLNFFLLLTSISCIISISQFLLFKEVNTFYENGALFDLQTNHVRFSIMNCLSIFISFYEYQQAKDRLKKSLLLLLTMLLFIYLHLNGVRTGILGFYLTIFISSISNFKKTTLSFALKFVSLILISFFLMYNFNKHFEQKVDTSITSIKEFLQSGTISNESDRGRIQSNKIALQIARKHLLFGVGIGDIKNSMLANNPSNQLLPHNQFIFVLLFSGLVGLIVFCFLLFKICTLKNIRHIDFHVLVCTIFVSSFLFDHTLETQLGLGLFLYFNLINIQQEPVDSLKQVSKVDV